MLDGMLGLGVVRQFRALGTLHARLHDLDVAQFENLMASGNAGDWVQDWSLSDWMDEHVAAASLHGLAPGLRWMKEHQPPALPERAVCHGDFHPINILMSGREVTGVIDWSMARVSDAAWDVGATAALMSQGPVDLPPFLFGLIGRVRGWLVGRYLKAYAATRSLDIERVRYYEAVRCLGFLIEAGEYIQAAAGVIAPINKATAFADAHVQKSIVRRFRQLTGIALTLPAASALTPGAAS
jgi:aminoglycoside phosphotransferase (APT) family kinase protein